jgi:hypothetical protein
MKKAGQEQELKEKQGGKLFFKLRVILGEEDDSGEGETFLVRRLSSHARNRKARHDPYRLAWDEDGLQQELENHPEHGALSGISGFGAPCGPGMRVETHAGRRGVSCGIQ